MYIDRHQDVRAIAQIIQQVSHLHEMYARLERRVERLESQMGRILDCAVDLADAEYAETPTPVPARPNTR